MQAPHPVSAPRMKVVLVTSFEDYFLEQDTLPELARRGVEVFSRFEAKACGRYDFHAFKAEGVDLILHMNEVGSHSASEKLSQLARDAGIPIRALSRKKASWTFLPPGLDGAPPSLDGPPSAPDSGRTLRARSHRHGFGIAATLADVGANGDSPEPGPLDLGEGLVLHPGLSPDPEVSVPDPVRQHIVTTRFSRKEARLRDVVRLVVAHGITDYARVFAAVDQGRQMGVFPRLVRMKREDLPKLVRSMLAHEMNDMKGKTHNLHLYQEDQPALASLGLDTEATRHRVDVAEAIAVLEEEDTMTSGKVVPMQKPETADEMTKLRARVAELEKLEQAHAALSRLVALGYMTSTEAALKLFPPAGAL